MFNLSISTLLIRLFQLQLCWSYLNTVFANEDESFLDNAHYLKYNELTSKFKDLETEYPTLVKVHSIGKSMQNRDLLAIEVSENVNNRTLLKPMFKYVANMHGDETVGREIVIFMAEYLLKNFDKIERIRKLVQSTDIFLMPSMNPDGFEAAMEGDCDSPNLVGRGNAAGVDLNRDFPDQFDKASLERSFDHFQNETVAVMKWIRENPFVLSGNLHGGTIVASYPFDGCGMNECANGSAAPDNAVFKALAHVYASKHPTMTENTCPDDSFVGGITNGAHWYDVRGGMQDFNYLHSNCFEVTLELSCCKYPNASTLKKEWQLNKESMISFMEATHWGAKGLVKDAIKMTPLEGAEIIVDGINHTIVTSARGEYWRLLTPGTYSISAKAPGYEQSKKHTVVIKGPEDTVRLDFNLNPAPELERLVDKSKNSKYDDFGFLFPQEFKYHNYLALEEKLKKLNSNYPDITHLYSIGKSVQGRELYVLIISQNPLVHEPGKPEFKYVANMHGDETVGREMLLLLAEYLCQNFGSNPRVGAMLRNIRIHILPSLNPDGYEASTEGDTSKPIGRHNANNIDLNRDFPDQYVFEESFNHQPETLAVMDWLKKFPFVLSANLHGGALVANYPFDDNQMMRKGANYSPDNDVFVLLAKTYSNAHPRMHKGLANCPDVPKEKFTGGIVNGAMWYVVAGGMQDYNYVSSNCFELTIEMGCDKFPPASELPRYWMENREPLLTYIEQVHRGVHGFVRSTSSSVIPNATISVEGIHHTVKTAADGDYWRLLAPGKYNISASAPGYDTEQVTVTVPDNHNGTSVNFTLLRNDPRSWAIEHDFGETSSITSMSRYLTKEELAADLRRIDAFEPSLSLFEMTSFGAPYLKISNQVGAPSERKFNILIVGGLYDTEPAGREIAFRLAKHLTSGYQSKELFYRKLLDNCVIHIIPVLSSHFDHSETELNCHAADNKMNPVANAFASNNVDSSPIAKGLLSLIYEVGFDFIFSIEGGGISLNHPHVDDDHLSESIYQMLDDGFTEKRPPDTPTSCRESSNSGSSDFKQNVLEYFRAHTKALIVSVRLSCCNYNAPNVIPQMWRNYLQPFMNMLSKVLQGVEGKVENLVNEPLRNAIIHLNSSTHKFYVTKNDALFKIVLPPGVYRLQVSCQQYLNTSVEVEVTQGKMTSINLVLRKAREDAFVIPHKGFGISGIVTDTQKHPLEGAVVSVNEKSTVVNSFGAYWLPLEPGEHTVKVSAQGFVVSTKLATLMKEKPEQTLIFRLLRDETVMGLPRLVFILLSGLMGMMTLGIGFCCYTHCRRKSSSVGFSLIPQKSTLFDDDDDEKDTELFRTPIRGSSMITRPYYDESDLDIDDGSLSEEDLIVVK